MSPCGEVRELLGAWFEGELDAASAARVCFHLDECAECGELAATLEAVAAAVRPLAALEPPPHLAEELARSPCRRWLELLFRAVDHELCESNLARLLEHLESCEGCRSVWNDLTLIRQVGEAMEPSAQLLGRCVAAPAAVRRPRVLGRRTMTAAAYLLAVTVSLALGNPVTLARHEQVVESLAATVSSGVGGAAQEGRGELRVMLWRAWQWGARKVTTVERVLHLDRSDDNLIPNQGGPP